MIKAIIFDWSGVLCDDLRAVYNADMAVFKAYGLQRLSLEEYRQVAELPWTEFYRKRGITDFKKIAEIFLRSFSADKRGKPIPDAKQVLEWLHKKKIRSAVLSAKTKKILLQECKQFGFDCFIQAIESWIDKRHAINDLIEKLREEKKSILFVGDMVHDIETARHAGIKSVAVLSGYSPREKVLKAKPDYAIETVGELPALIKKLNGESND